MTIPTRATATGAPADPRDEVDYILDMNPVLEDDEELTDYVLALPAESIALGMEIKEGGGYDHTPLTGTVAEALGYRDNTAILCFITIADAYRANAAFDGNGISLPIEMTMTTNSVPPRTRQRTFLLPVVQQ